MIRRSKASPAVLFDEFHERSLDADLGLALRSTRRGPARGPAASCHVGDARRRAGALGSRRCAADRERRPRLPGRDALCRPRIQARGSKTRSRARRSKRSRGERLDPGLPAGNGRNPPRRGESWRRGSGGPTSTSRRSMERWTRARRTSPSRPPQPGRRKIVLATSIAETSLTIEGVRVVIDSGLMRVPVYEPDVGLTRLETVRVSRANADQRRGRAGRVEPGVCYRLWKEAANGGLQPYAAPEISPPISRASCSIARCGAFPIRRRSPSSIPRRAPRSPKRGRF